MTVDRVANFEENRRQQLETLEVLARQQANPVYLWEALYLCLNPPGDYPKCDLPSWCLPYLAWVAADIAMLGGLRDTSTFPVRQPDEDAAGYAARRREWEAAPDIKPKRALELVARRLGFTRKGWNAFARYAEDQRLMSAVMQYEHLERRQKGSGDKLMRRVFNLDSPRSVRVRLRRGSELRARRRREPTP